MHPSTDAISMEGKGSIGQGDSKDIRKSDPGFEDQK
jgi:hypothetical protein